MSVSDLRCLSVADALRWGTGVKQRICNELKPSPTSPTVLI